MKNYIIFICAFDPFGKGRHVYHFENLCREDPAQRLEDGTEKVFLNTKGINEPEAPLDGVNEELLGLLKYFESQTPQDAFTEELDKAVADARLHKEWRLEYMKLELMMMDSRREGRKEGETLGEEKGITKGEMKKLINQVCRKLAKGKAPEAIAEDLEEDPCEVRLICDIAAKYAPDYDIEKILEKVLADKEKAMITSVKTDRQEYNIV